MRCNLTVKTVQEVFKSGINCGFGTIHREARTWSAGGKWRSGLQAIVGLSSGGKQVIKSSQKLCLERRLPCGDVKEGNASEIAS